MGVKCSLIVNNFAKYFESCCMPFNNERNIELKARYKERRADYVSCPINNNQLIDVELLSNLIFRMKKGKAADLDELSCEHLMYCHPIIVIILSKLFKLFIELGHDPQGFDVIYLSVMDTLVLCRSMILEESLLVLSYLSFLSWQY